MEKLNEFDLAFVVDTTGSMAGLLDAAKAQMVGMIGAATKQADVDVRLAVIEYRDHPPQDRLVYRVHPFTVDLQEAQDTISGLRADGGGDAPEAVLDGILAACQELNWRPHARRVAVLVGDAPPHGCGCGGDRFPKGCPCGQTIESATAAAEEQRVTLYAIGLRPEARDSFHLLASFTGGEFFAPDSFDGAIRRLESILTGEFGNLELDRRVLAACRETEDWSIDDIAERLSEGPGDVARSITRLMSRRILNSGVTTGS